MIAPKPRVKRATKRQRKWELGALALFFLALYGYLNVTVPWRALEQTGGDFEHYYDAARALLAGQSPFRVYGFDYPPLLAFLVAPSANLPLHNARVVWFCISQLCLLGAAFGTWRGLGSGGLALTVVGVVWCVAGTVPENLVLGQVTPLLLLLLVLGSRLYRRHPSSAAALLGVAAALKLWPVVLLGPLALGRRWRPFFIGLAVAGLLIVMPLLFVGAFLGPPALPESSGYWMGTPAALNFSLPAIVLRATDPPVASGPLPADWVQGNNPRMLDLSHPQALASVGTSFLTLAVVFLVLRRPMLRAPGEASEQLFLAALVSTCVLASPISWYHYQLVQFGGLALLGTALIRRRALGSLVAVAVLGFCLTRTHSLGFGRYVEAYGWTAAHPILLWGILSLVPVLNASLIVLLLREAMRTGRLDRGAGSSQHAVQP